MCELQERSEAIVTPRYLYSVTTVRGVPSTVRGDCVKEYLVFLDTSICLHFPALNLRCFPDMKEDTEFAIGRSQLGLLLSDIELNLFADNNIALYC